VLVSCPQVVYLGIASVVRIDRKYQLGRNPTPPIGRSARYGAFQRDFDRPVRLKLAISPTAVVPSTAKYPKELAQGPNSASRYPFHFPQQRSHPHAESALLVGNRSIPYPPTDHAAPVRPRRCSSPVCWRLRPATKAGAWSMRPGIGHAGTRHIPR